MALTKKSLNNFLPNGFETQNKDGYKANFTNDRIISGFEKDTLEVLSGPNLNNFIDKTGKNFNTLNDLLEYFNAMPIDSFPIVNASNQLDYKSINSFFRNVGELVFSSVPIDDKNLHLADGSLLDGKGTYRVFVDFIGGLASKYPSLFTDEATWQATVKKYGTCAKYVWDATNKTLRIPRLKGLIEATIDKDSIGNITEAGLPNITGRIGGLSHDSAQSQQGMTGAFYWGTAKINGAGSGSNDRYGFFDASRSSSVYGKSNTVQPQTVKQYIYIVVSVDTEETTKLTSVFQYRGSVPTFEDLPTEGNITGDVWNVDETDVNYVWDGNEWDQLSGSVDLTGYYTKEQADTRFATVTSLESNVENLQSKITQNTTDIASLGLGNVISSSLEKGKALKYLETKGNITEDADVYNDVYNYKHSSFDLNKFKVVGTPNITENGVASGFSGSNYLTFDTSNIDWTKPYHIKVKISLENEVDLSNMITRQNMPIIQLHESYGSYRFRFSPATSVEAITTVGQIRDTEEVVLGTTYLLEAIYDGTQYTFKKNGTVVGTSTTLVTDLTIGGVSILGQNTVARGYLHGSIDLKHFSITVDGKEVFNGNKTGLDAVKPDNYTVVGSPVISDDGVVVNGLIEGESITSNTIKLSQLKGKSWKYTFKTTIPLDTQTGKYIISFADSPYPSLAGGIKFEGAGIYLGGQFGTADENTGQIWNTVGYITSADKGKDIIFEISFNVSTGEYIVIGEFNNKKVQLIFIPNTTNKELYYLNTNTALNAFRIISRLSIFDLNSFKIYVDDELVYQPCLKIPYNISKTGLKVANADARERVIGMGEDYGYSQYFTIDEENKNATLPIGAGITGRQDLIASFDDGVNKYEQFSDLTFKQSGKCTANTAVTFIQPYKDDTYKISVPYSAKTKTGFTPTVSGDWFAEGKIYLD